MRYVVFGAGAIGGTIGARLFESGFPVALIARGGHLAAIRERGLLVQSPGGEVTLPIPAFSGAADAGIGPDDRVILATKTQDSAGALDDLAAACGPGVAIVCAQNGVENERIALRRFEHVYAMRVVMPAEHLAPGVVRYSLAPIVGVLDLGVYPWGADATGESIAADLTAAGFISRVRPDVMRWKYAKLLGNLANALEAACGPGARDSDVMARARAEGEAALRAAGIDWAREPDEAVGRTVAPAGGGGPRIRSGGSTWQSLARGTGSVEADYLNGEIALLGRLHGVPTPVNSTLQRIAGRLARDRVPPGSMSIDDVLAEVD